MAEGELKRHIDTIEETYEFLLAYAAKGLPGDKASSTGSQLREYLTKTETALGELADLCRRGVREDKLSATESFDAFIDVLERDAQSSRAAIRLVLAQASISSQLVDNLNASIHLRALLTDVFLIDEAMKAARVAGAG